MAKENKHTAAKVGVPVAAVALAAWLLSQGGLGLGGGKGTGSDTAEAGIAAEEIAEGETKASEEAEDKAETTEAEVSEASEETTEAKTEETETEEETTEAEVSENEEESEEAENVKKGAEAETTEAETTEATTMSPVTVRIEARQDKFFINLEEVTLKSIVDLCKSTDSELNVVIEDNYASSKTWDELKAALSKIGIIPMEE